MFGHNSIVGQSYFKDAGDNLFVTSIFGVTLQGEGPYRGEPAVFVRLAKCQLACSFCDTFFDDGDWMTVDQIDQRIQTVIEQYFNGSIPLWASELPSSEFQTAKPRDMVLVVTGGEPMLQKNIGPFLKHMSKKFAKTQIESNGLLVQDIPESTTLVVSPKCSEKNGQPTQYLTPNPKMLERANCLKFVMSADLNSPYGSVPIWAHEWRDKTGNPVFVSPMNIYNEEPQKSKRLRAEKNQISLEERSTVDEVISWWTPGLLNMAENQRNHEYAARYAVSNGFVFNMQLHLFGNLA
jgi:hypothetical protein